MTTFSILTLRVISVFCPG